MTNATVKLLSFSLLFLLVSFEVKAQMPKTGPAAPKGQQQRASGCQKEEPHDNHLCGQYIQTGWKNCQAEFMGKKNDAWTQRKAGDDAVKKIPVVAEGTNVGNGENITATGAAVQQASTEATGAYSSCIQQNDEGLSLLSAGANRYRSSVATCKAFCSNPQNNCEAQVQLAESAAKAIDVDVKEQGRDLNWNKKLCSDSASAAGLTIQKGNSIVNNGDARTNTGGSPAEETVSAGGGGGSGAGNLLLGGLAGAGLGFAVGGMLNDGGGGGGGHSSDSSSTTTSVTCPAGQSQSAYGTCIAPLSVPTNTIGSTTEPTGTTTTTTTGINVGPKGSLDTGGGLTSGTPGGAVGRGGSGGATVPVAGGSGSGLASDPGSSSGSGKGSGSAGSAVGRGIAMLDSGGGGGGNYRSGSFGGQSDTAPADAVPGTVYFYNYVPKDHPRGYKWVKVGARGWNLIPDCRVNPAACRTRVQVQKKIKRSLASDSALK